MHALAHTVRPTDIRPAPVISAALGRPVLLISELGQQTGSFKYRAASHVAASVPNDHLITASSGNFGQALALAGRLRGQRVQVVMPQTSAQVKIAAVRAQGAEVVLIDTAATTRAAQVAALAAQHPDAFVASAYDDPLVIAGNSSLGVEIARAARGLAAVVVPVGGGGLSAGIIQGLRGSGDTTPVFGAEPLLGSDAARSLRAGVLLANETEPATLADGARTLSLGRHTWAILQHSLAGIVEISEADIVAAMRLLAQEGLRVEPTGALSIAALLAQHTLPSGLIGCVLSGGNVDEALYQQICG